MSKCIVLVCNKKYLSQFEYTYNLLRTTGKYNDDIVLVVGDDLKDLKYDGVIVKYFKNISFPDSVVQQMDDVNTDGRNITKRFQWHKLHIFKSYFKKWKWVLYIDCGMKIYEDISPFFNLFTKNKVVAHSDAYPTFKWTLKVQFDDDKPSYQKISKKYNLNCNYFQTGMMLYDTDIIHSNTFQDLYNLSCKYPISRTNEQGIMCLYFICIKEVWKEMPIHRNNLYFYDIIKRNKNDNYIMTKRDCKDNFYF